MNRVTGPKHSSGSTLYAITYNSLGQRTKLNRGAGNAVTNYTYDGVGRLATFNDDLPSTANDVTWTFSYSPAGQVANWSATSTNYDYIEPVSGSVPQTYDGLNRDSGLVSVSGYDLRGNIIKEGATNAFGQVGRAFTYDEFNRFLTAATPAAPATHTADLTYDPEGRLVRYSDDNNATSTTFVYDGTNVIVEYNGTGTTVLRRYVFGPGTDEPIVWYEGSGVANRHYLVTNYQGSIIATLDSGFNLENTYEYGPRSIRVLVAPGAQSALRLASATPARWPSIPVGSTTTRPESTIPQYGQSFAPSARTPHLPLRGILSP
ncbi:MAG: hypothetical protein WDN06_16235 [Asticcacaulis sp.]